MQHPNPLSQLDRRCRILCARLAQALYLPEIVGWLNERITR